MHKLLGQRAKFANGLCWRPQLAHCLAKNNNT